eukprot:g1518.t1
MASRKGYTSLPADSETGNAALDAEQSGGGAAAVRGRTTGADESSVGARGDASSGKDSTSGSTTTKESPGAEKAGESAEKDLTGGLPVAEGVFVGDPVTQSTYGASGGGGGGGGIYNPSAPQATVITSAPPGYQNHVVAASAAAAAAGGGDGRGIAMPHQGTGQHTVIVMNGPPGHQFGEWGREPQLFVCRACGFSGLTATMTDPCSNMPILAAACCCLIGLWPCSFVPFLIPELRDTVHRCPNCHLPVGRSRQFR